MKVLIDTNVLIDFILMREPYASNAEKISFNLLLIYFTIVVNVVIVVIVKYINIRIYPMT